MQQGWVPFDLYLRRGVTPSREAMDRLECKYNPWHDPEDGRFTFAGSGIHVPHAFGGGAKRRIAPGQEGSRRTGARAGPAPARVDGTWTGGGFTGGGGGRFGGGGATATYPWPDPRPKTAAVKPGVTRPSPGGAAAGLQRANATTRPEPVANGRSSVPPAMTRVGPTAAGQRSPHEVIVKNGYRFTLDARRRTTDVSGTISLAAQPRRSPSNQARAGKPDRLPTDDGGHYIAARFNGPTDEFNHFAQDGNFNRGAYRVLEDKWARAKKAGHDVFVRVRVNYREPSKRPSSLAVSYRIDGRWSEEAFRNNLRGGR